MAAVISPATWLVDTSALARLSAPEVGDVLRPLIDAGPAAVTAVTLLEVGYAARSGADHERSQRSVLQRLQFVYGRPRSERRAEIEGLAVIHYDADFDRIAEVTGQPSQWVVEAGTVS